MNEKNLRNLGIIAIVLVVVIVVLSVVSSNQTNSAQQNLLSFSKDSIDKIQFTGKNNFTLALNAGTWKADTYNVDQAKMDSFLQDLNSAKIKYTVSTDKNNFPKFGLDDQSATKVVVSAKNSDKTFYVGTSVQDGGCYVRLDGQDSSLIVSSDFTTSLANGISSFRDKTITSLDVNKIQQVEYPSYKIKKDQTNWVSESDPSKKYDQTKASALIQALATMKADDFLSTTDSSKVDTTKPVLVVTIKTDSETKISIYQYNSQYIVQKEGDTTFYILSSDNFDAINKKESDIV